MIRKLIPAGVKRNIRLAQRKQADRKSGIDKKFAQISKVPFPQEEVFIHQIKQPIFYNPLAANKVFNIGLAIEEIHKVVIPPGGVFSFWHIVGNPTVDKGYKTGRNIIGDSLKEDIGGGLCQVSGMIYHLALTCGMEICERHNHTLDLYEEDKRYTPLGADATVVYGYKDLRFKNVGAAPVFMRFEVSETEFKGAFYSGENLPVYDIDFERAEFDDYRTIKTYRISDKDRVYINSSKYLLRK